MDEWERRNSLQSNDHFRIFREALQREVLREREASSFVERRRAVLLAMLIIQHEPAASIGASVPSSNAVHLPSIDEGIAYLEREECDRLVKDLLGGSMEACHLLEAALDAHRGFLRFAAEDIASEKDRRIVQDFVGWAPDEIVKADRSLGPEAAIRRARTAAEVDSENGKVV